MLLKGYRDIKHTLSVINMLSERSARTANSAQLAASQEQLREVLTLEQEAKLVALNVLD